MSFEMRKDYKKISAKLYLLGMSKNNIYRTMKQNGLNVKRKEIRDYLKISMYAKTSDYTRYRTRYNMGHKMLQHGMIKDLQHEHDRLNTNYLIYVSIDLLKNKKIKYSKPLKRFVHQRTIGKYVIEWTS